MAVNNHVLSRGLGYFLYCYADSALDVHDCEQLVFEGAFLKFESVTQQFQPEFLEIVDFPQISYDCQFGKSIFSASTTRSKQVLLLFHSTLDNKSNILLCNGLA